MNVKEVNDLKENLISNSNKGFGSFFKNILMIILIVLIMFICSNPVILLHPEEVIGELNGNVFFAVGILFLLICGTYQLGVDINKESNIQRNKQVVKEIKSAEIDIKKQEENAHNELVKKRIKNSPLIRSELKDLLIKLGAQRATVCEMHNGTNNLAGIPFLYMDMTYEEKSPDAEYITDEYHNFNMGKYPFMTNHFDSKSWIGSIQEVEKEDEHLATKLKLGDSKYGGWVVLRGMKSVIGFLCVTFNDENEHPDKATIMSSLTSSAQLISALLDKNY